MNDLINQLLEAHIQHELNRFRDGNFKQTISEEVAAAFEWISDIKLKDVMTAEQVLGIIRRNVVELPVAGGITERILSSLDTISGSIFAIPRISKKFIRNWSGISLKNTATGNSTSSWKKSG